MKNKFLNEFLIDHLPTQRCKMLLNESWLENLFYTCLSYVHVDYYKYRPKIFTYFDRNLSSRN